MVLNQRQLCDVELILNGGFNPLEGFMGEADYNRVCHEMRLTDGSLFPIPVTLDIDVEFARQLQIGETIVLTDAEANPLAYMAIESLWKADKNLEAQNVLGTSDIRHPQVHILFEHSGEFYVGGKLTKVKDIIHHDFKQLRHSPEELKHCFRKLGWSNVVAFQTRNPIHRAHFELMQQALVKSGAKLLLHPVVGQTKIGDVNHYTRVRCYQQIVGKFAEDSAMLSLLPLAMRMAGPREALWHALIRKNYGATAFIVGRDHAGPGNDSAGNPFYDPYAAQELVKQHQGELEMEILTFSEYAYVENRKCFLPANELKADDKVLNISGTKFRSMLEQGEEIPEWFSFPEVIHELRKTFPPREKQGFTIFFTGLSGAGKSTLANALINRLQEFGDHQITLLDGDIVRTNLSSELGFSREHRDLNIRRIGYVASEITKHRGIAVCAPIAPYQAIRDEVRQNINEYGGFIEVYVATPLAICETRDSKGLYQLARQGVIKNFTGISDPYEEPVTPELKIDTSQTSLSEAITMIIAYLHASGYIKDVK